MRNRILRLVIISVMITSLTGCGKVAEIENNESAWIIETYGSVCKDYAAHEKLLHNTRPNVMLLDIYFPVLIFRQFY